VSLVPLRVHDSVIHFSWGNLAKALYHAADSGCHVVSMSLGGPWAGNTLRRAVEYAAAKGVILLSAAGNHTRVVVIPAIYPQVIAVAGSNARDELWSGSALGKRVAVTAPGESVWRGRAETGRGGQPEFCVKRSSGTSYATALTAGACALWLQRHGRDQLLQRYGSSGIAAAFRSALQGSVRRPPGWPTSKAGPGIVDVDGLIKAPLPAAVPAPLGLSASAVHPSIEAIAMLNDSTAAQARKWARDTLGVPDNQLDAKLDLVGAELSLNLLRKQLLRSPAPPPLPMSAQPRDGVSQRLRAAAPGL
jgi:subtilisin family serine protease